MLLLSVILERLEVLPCLNKDTAARIQSLYFVSSFRNMEDTCPLVSEMAIMRTDPFVEVDGFCDFM